MRLTVELAGQDKVAIWWHTNKGRRAGQLIINRVSHSPEMARKVCSDEADPRPSQETKDQQGTWAGTHTYVLAQAYVDQARIKGESQSFNVVKLTAVWSKHDVKLEFQHIWELMKHLECRVGAVREVAEPFGALRALTAASENQVVWF